MKELPVHNVSFGNDSKCGPTCATISRPTVQTCPSDCPFATGVCSDGREIPKRFRCYAVRCERRRPNVEKNWQRGITAGEDYSKWIASTTGELIRLATRKRGRKLTCFRVHVGGDLCRGGVLDEPYIKAICAVIHRLRLAAPSVKVWLYTHAWRRLAVVKGGWYKLLLEETGAEVLASVHTKAEADEAVAFGYRLAVDLGECKVGVLDYPAIQDWNGHKVTTCPHQRGKIDDCATCGLCFKDNGRHVGFILH